MKRSHAASLLVLLPALLPAAPAPFVREKKPEPGGWSKPVDGIRVRLVAPQTRYRVGEEIRLVLEIQNVSGGTLAIEEPELYPLVSRQATPGWTITSKREGRHRAREEEDVLLKRLGALRRLAGGATLRVEITAKGGEEMKQQEALAEDEEPRRQELYFPDGDVPGVYQFRVTYSRGPRGKAKVFRDLEEGWNPDLLESPPVRIELVK